MLLLLVVSARAEPSVLLKESRAWQGELVIERRADGEVHREVATFMLLTDPTRTAGSRKRLKMRQRSVRCEWSLLLDQRESQGVRDLITKGEGGGRMLIAVSGTVDTASGHARLRISTKRRRLLAKTMLSGVDSKGFAAHQTVASRTPLLASLAENGKLSADGRMIVGERVVEERRGKKPRTLTVRWTLRRMDPEVRGRILDRDGQPVAGMKVVAQTMGQTGMIVRTGTSGKDGRFSIMAHFGPWGVRVKGRVANGIVTSGWSQADAVRLILDEESSLDVRVERYQLKKLPEASRLRSYFDGDVDAYLEYVTGRSSAARLRAARATSSAPSPVEAAAPRR